MFVDKGHLQFVFWPTNVQAKYKCKLRHVHLSVVSSPEATNPGKVPLIPQRNKKEGVSISTVSEKKGVQKWPTGDDSSEMLLSMVFKDPGTNSLLFMASVIEGQK